MSLQKRLTLVFILIVILPLAAAGLIVQRLVVGEVGRRAELALGPALDSAVVVYNGHLEVLDERVRSAVGVTRFGMLLRDRDKNAVVGFLSRRLAATDGLDFLIARDAQGRMVGSAVRPPDFLEGYQPPSIAEIAEGPRASEAFVRGVPTRVGLGLRDVKVGSVVGGFWLDKNFLVAPQGDVELSVAVGDRVVAATSPLEGAVSINPREGTFDLSLDEESRGRMRELEGGAFFVASTPEGPIAALSRRLYVSVLGLLLLALIVTAVLANLLSRLITQPLEDLAAGARAVTAGRYDQQIKVRSKDEVGQLAEAFNDMTARLQSTIGQLSSSRDQMHRAVRRVGETLRSTHDMTQMLDTILSTAADAAEADAAALWRFSPTREELFPALVEGMPAEELGRVRVGDGVAGLVAERGTTVLLPGTDGGPHPAVGEPGHPVVAAMPLYSQNRVTGVLSVYRNEGKPGFNGEDLETLIFLAEQGGVAIENILLHDEARRLSLTDGLTGAWNRRYFRMQFNQVVATSTRFKRHFSLLMLDLDHFKQINDTYGHRRGDQMLVEFTDRVNNILREVDTLARYGGEEFICLLSETDLYGALTTAEKILEEVRMEPFGGSEDDPIRLTVSIGVASYPEHGDNFSALVDSADGALYRAKAEGRDRAYAAQTGAVAG